MTTNTHDLITLAKSLRRDSVDEATLRCAVSRSYYAALHKADEVFPLRDPNARRVGEGTHEQIIARAQAHGNSVNPGRTSAQNVAKLLPKMKRLRVKADYHLDEDVNVQECDEAIQRAEYVINECDQIDKKLVAAVEQSVVPIQPQPTLIRIR